MAESLIRQMIAPRKAKPTLSVIDKYCDFYRNLFSDVRSYEAFKDLHVGILSDIQRKTLPAIAKINGLENAQGLHHFLTKSPWEVKRSLSENSKNQDSSIWYQYEIITGCGYREEQALEQIDGENSSVL